ncbi:hypothetical protein BsWGS_21432 [Bradybaena similaris]
MACSEIKDDDLFLSIKGVIFVFMRRLFFSNGLGNPLFSQNISLHFQFSHIRFTVWPVCRPSHFWVYHSVMVPNTPSVCWRTPVDGRDTEQKEDLEKDGQAILQRYCQKTWNDHDRCNTKGQRQKITTPHDASWHCVMVCSIAVVFVPFGPTHLTSARHF